MVLYVLSGKGVPLFSVVIPVYKNEANVIDLLNELNGISGKFNGPVEIVFVVDGSPDRSELMLKENINILQCTSKVVSLTRNFGSFAAIRAGLSVSSGKYIGVIAADLQEPPSLLLDFHEKLLSNDYDIAFGSRESREDPLLSTIFSKTFWKLYKKFINPEIPDGGVDVFAINQKVKDEILKLDESNSSLVGLLFWVGFRRCFVGYKRKKREKGTSGWSFPAKVKYLMDSIFSFTDLPIKMVMRLGFLALSVSFVLGLIILISKLSGKIPLPGYAPITLILTTFTGFNALVMAVIGNYVWRAFENTKQRPTSIIRNIDEFNA